MATVIDPDTSSYLISFLLGVVVWQNQKLKPILERVSKVLERIDAHFSET